MTAPIPSLRGTIGLFSGRAVMIPSQLARLSRTDAPVGAAGGPLVIVTGWTASGKTTLAERMSRAGLARVTGSSMLLPLLGDPGSGKASRLRSWLSTSVDGVPRDGETDRLADLAVLRLLAARTGGVVAESAGSLPLLLSPYNDALLVRLDAAPRIRAARVRRFLHDEVDAQDAARIVRRKDATTASACLTSWGLDLNNPVHHRRYDLTLACPDVDACVDPHRCVEAISALLGAACGVYAGFLNADRHATATASVQLRDVLDRHWPWVRRICSTLTTPVEQVTPQRWLDRLAYHTPNTEVPRMGASC